MVNETKNNDEKEVSSESLDTTSNKITVSEGTDNPPKRRRGRPRKSESVKKEDATDSKPKRRGRPRKRVEEAESQTSTETDASEEKPKRRGRPRKKEEKTPIEATLTEETSESKNEQKPKRRGRPRKKSTEPSSKTDTQEIPSTNDIEPTEQETPVVASEDKDILNGGLRRRRIGGVRRTIAQAEGQTELPLELSSEDVSHRVRRTRRSATEEELRLAKAEVDEARKLASIADVEEEIALVEEIEEEAQEVEPEVIVDVEETKPEKAKRKKSNEPTLSIEDLSSWKVAELREKAKELDLDPTGIRKPQLIELVYEASAKREGYKSFSGIFEPTQEGFGFIRSKNYISSKEDVFVAKHLIRKFGLRAGDLVEGTTQPPRAHNQLPQLLSVDTINGLTIEEARKRPRFKNLTPIYPDEQLVLEHGKDSITGRAIDILAPIGKGQRGLIVSPPKAGKTTILKKICESISENNSEVKLICLLIDERPEEVTDMRRSIKGEVVASTFDMPPENHTQISELVMERAKRLVEQGEDVVVVLDSITRLARAYNLALPASGRILSGGFDSAALYPPKRFLGAARNIEGGGSLTIIASALIDTGSKMDEVIFEEFKGTGNMELKLDRYLANKRIYPAIDPIASGTRNENLLVDNLTLKCMWGLRRTLANINNIERAQTMLIKGLKSTETNQEFLLRAAKKANMSEYADLDKTEN